MNAAISPIRFQNHTSSFAGSPAMKPIPQMSDHDDDIEAIINFQMFDPPNSQAGSLNLPGKPLLILDTESMIVPASLIRRIERELREDDYDSRTVFSACRGLTRGTPEFEDAYIAARIRSYTKHRKNPTDQLLGRQFNGEPALPEMRLNILDFPLSPPIHPMAVLHLGHLFQHFGIWVTALFGIQALAAWRISALADEFLEGGRYFYLAAGLFLLLAIDTRVWFQRRGNLSAAFHAPGAVLFLMALLPITALYLRGVLLSFE